jgi:hypothetical protein
MEEAYMKHPNQGRWSLFLMVLIILLLTAGTSAAKTQFISIGTGGTGGIYYPYGGGVAEIWSKYVPGIKAVAEVTGASVENVKLAHKGETVVGEVMGDVAVAGFQGLSKFQGKKARYSEHGHHVSQPASSRYPEIERHHQSGAGQRTQYQHGKPWKRHQFHGRSGA